MSRMEQLNINIKGNYKIATDWMRNKQIYTKQNIIDFYMDKLSKDYKAACGSAIILLSPRIASKHGDLRGSTSNPWGHIAYNEKLERRFDPNTGKKEKQRYRFRFRDVPLDKKCHTYYQRKSEQEKIANDTTTKTVTKGVEVTENKNA